MTTTRLLAWAAALALVSPHVAKAASGTVSAIPSVPVAHPQLSGTMDHSARKLPRDLQHQLDQIPLLDREVGAPPVAGSTAPAPRRHQRRARAATVASSWVGASDANWTPSDTNAAFGPAYVLQAVNSRVVGYSRSGAVQSLNESLCTFLNVTSSDCFDPRVIYDYESGRFIATAIVTYSSTSSAIVYMYSTSLTPTHANWCRFNINYGIFADYDMLGDAGGVVGIGFNEYPSTSGSASFTSAHFIRIVKPAKGATGCQTPAQLGFTESTNLLDGNGHKAFAPYPADTTDAGQKGYILARSLSLPSSNLWLFSYSPTTMPGAGKAVPLGYTYDVPPLATQAGTKRLVDTGDARLWKLQAAIDPARGKLLLNFAHTVPAAQGFQADSVMVRVDPATASWVDRQRLHADGLSTFAAVMSSNRQCNNGACSGGSGWVVAATQSGAPAGLNPRAVVYGSSAPTTAKVLHAAGGPLYDFACPGSTDVCRMDYNGAEPDPVSDRVGVSVTWSGGSPNTTTSNWRTQNGFIQP
jgi:hypothetical protein